MRTEGALIGRSSDLQRISLLFTSGARAVSLIGPPGVGKTRLAREWASESEPPSVFCDLASARASDDFLRLLATALPLAGDAARAGDLFDHVAAVLVDRGAVTIVLDNAESVVAESWPLVPRLLEAAPRVRLLVTSREPLRIAPESCHWVAPLAHADALALFRERVGARHSHFAAQSSDGEGLSALVARLEGLPLAIEIVAAQCGVYSVPRLDEQLSLRLNQLPNDMRGAPERHGSLQAAIEVSWQLFDPVEQSALAQCSLFRGGFTIESAEAVLDLGAGAPPVFEVLRRLHTKSFLVVRSDEGERRMALLESIRVFAAEKLAGGGEEGAALERFVRYMARQGESWTARVRATDDAEARRQRANEVDNLLEAWRRGAASPDDAPRALLAACEVLRDLVPPQDLLGRIDTASCSEAGWPLALRAELAATRADLLGYTGQSEQSVRLAREAIALSQEAGSAATEAWAAFLVARTLSWEDRPAEAQAMFEHSLRVARSQGLRLIALRASLQYAWIESSLGHWQRARPLCRQVLDGARSLGSGELIARGSILAGLVEVHDGRLGDAEEAFRESLEASLAGGHRWCAAWARECLSTCALERGDLEAARSWIDEVLSKERAVPFIMEGVLMDAGIVRHTIGELDEAAGLLTEAVELRRGQVWGGGAAIALLHLGAVEAERGRLQEAETAFAEAEDCAGASSREVAAVRPVLLGFLALARAERAVAAGLTEEACDLHREVVAHRSAPVVDMVGRGRRARLLLGRALDRSRLAQCERDQQMLAIASDLTWIRPPRGRRIELSPTSPNRRLLARLVEERQRQPGHAVPAPDLGLAGWPDASVPDRARRERLKVTIYAMRRRGLTQVVLARGGGYLLDPNVPLAIVDVPADSGERTSEAPAPLAPHRPETQSPSQL